MLEWKDIEGYVGNMRGLMSYINWELPRIFKRFFKR